MRRSAMLLGAAALSVGCFCHPRSRNDGERLEQESDVLVGRQGGTPYEEAVVSVFARGYYSNIIARVICLPWEECEWMVGLTKDGDDFAVFALKADTPIWDTYNLQQYERGEVREILDDGSLVIPTNYIRRLKEETLSEFDQIAVRESVAPIARRTGALVLTVWRKMVGRALYRDKGSGIGGTSGGYDGRTYHFSVPDPSYGHVGATTWSPTAESNCGRLVALAKLMVQYAEAPVQTRPGIEGQIRTLASSLLRRIE